jgi:AraC-like DNA-binding protein
MSPASALARLRERVQALTIARAGDAGHATVLQPDLCLYRLGAPTTMHKAATFGLTLAAVLQGTKRIRIGGHELEVRAGNLLVVTREAAHTSIAESASAEEPFVALSFCFSAERVARALLAVTEGGAIDSTPRSLRSLVDPAPVETVPAFVLGCDDRLASALERLLQTLDDPLDRRVLAPLIQDEILYRLIRSDAAAAVRGGVTRAPDAGRIVEAMQFIRDHHTEKLTVEALAKRSAMSASHFAHRFSAVARITPMRYLREVRLEQARAFLLAGGARAGDVALRVGFENPSHFAREFKRRYGLSPSGLRPRAQID